MRATSLRSAGPVQTRGARGCQGRRHGSHSPINKHRSWTRTRGSVINDLYKGTTNPERVGNGATMDAIRHELATGGAVHGRRHLEKGRQYSNGLRNFLRRNPDASLHDRRVAQSLYDELQGAMGGR